MQKKMPNNIEEESIYKASNYLLNLIDLSKEKLISYTSYWFLMIGIGCISFYFLEMNKVYLYIFFPAIIIFIIIRLFYLLKVTTSSLSFLIFFSFVSYWVYIYLIDIYFFYLLLTPSIMICMVVSGYITQSRKWSFVCWLFLIAFFSSVVFFGIGIDYLYKTDNLKFKYTYSIEFVSFLVFSFFILGSFIVFMESMGFNNFLKKIPNALSIIEEAFEEQKFLNNNNLKISSNLKVASDLQHMILPKQKEESKISSNFEIDISGKMDPATEVGGDYYDIIEKDGNLYIGIGDVTDHGLESGVVMIVCQSSFLSSLQDDVIDIKKSLIDTNKVIYNLNQERMQNDRTMSLSFAKYTQDGNLYLTGQHEKAIICRQGKEIEWIETDDLGFIVGITDDIEPMVSEVCIQLEKGDSILFYTDGANEAENQKKQQLGEKAVADLFVKYNSLSSNDMLDAIYKDIYTFIDQAPVYDDITMVVLKRL